MIEEKAEKLATLLIEADITDEERAAWVKSLPKLTNEQIGGVIVAFEEEQRGIENLKKEVIPQLKNEILNILKEKEAAHTAVPPKNIEQ